MNSNLKYRILDIIRGTTVDGPGFRTAIYFAGCPHRCPGCHNPQSWNADNGTEYGLEDLIEIIREEEFNVTLTGGDPLMHPKEVAFLAKEIKSLGLSIWLYTGYTIDEIRRSPLLSLPLPYLEAVVDGPFIEKLRDPDLQFRGSSNQNIIYL